MAKSNKPANNSKPRVRVSFFGMLMILLGADLILLMAPDVGILNSGFYIPNIYSWSALAAGIALLVVGFRKLYREP